MDNNLEEATIIAFRITQLLKGADLRGLYLAKRVCCQLVGADALWVPMDPP